MGEATAPWGANPRLLIQKRPERRLSALRRSQTAGRYPPEPFHRQFGHLLAPRSDDLITAGVVAVNGKIVTELGTKVNPEDEVRFNGEIVKGKESIHPDEQAERLRNVGRRPAFDKTVMDLIKGACTERCIRSDVSTKQRRVLLFTNDGDSTRN
ncbi:MAG: S4 domain-containing protein [Alistipes sp.]